MKTKKAQQNNLLNSLEAYAKTNNLLDTKIAVACSAGIDSMCLLELALQSFKPENILCLHLDHGLRKDSYQAREFLVKYCEQKNIALLSKTYTAGELGLDENSARCARYDFFVEAASEHNCQHILLAHNLNDQAETILFRLFRGTGLSGLVGIPESRLLTENIKIHRPLLSISRKDIEIFVQTQGLAFIEDTSNSSLDYARNFIRHKILPLAFEINPAILKNLSQLGALAAEQEDFVMQESKLHMAELGALPWALEDFRKIPKLIQRKILEKTFTTNIAFVNDFLEAILQGGFHKINYEAAKFFTIRQKKIMFEDK